MLIAAWPDGTILWRQDDVYKLGIVPSNMVYNAVAKIREYGFYEKHFEHSNDDIILRPDGRERSITVFDGKKWRSSYFHEYQEFSGYGPNSYPTLMEMERFNNMWTNVVSIIKAIKTCESKTVKYEEYKWLPRFQ
jgi:hypothetical protein